MNVVKIYGGLGNQFFQYAFGKVMEKNGLKVVYETSFFTRPQNPPRPYCLDKFNTKEITRSDFIVGNTKIHENADLYYKSDLSLLKRDNCNFFGYWQNIAYFKHILPELEKEFRLKSEFHTPEFTKLWMEINSENSISLHIRRGDYITINGHHNLTLDYYKSALARINVKVQGQLYVFSDDIPWCKENFSDDVILVDLNEWQSFELMKTCKHNILANSTYSWWAAMLNSNPDKMIVCPKQWRKDSEEQRRIEQGDFLSNNWIRI